MLPFDIRHPSRDALLNLYEKRQAVADLQTADFAGVNATDVLKEFRHRLLQLEISGVFGRLAFRRPKFQNLYRGWPRVEHQLAALDSQEFEPTEGELLEGRDEALLGRQQIVSRPRANSSR
jgi:hypothetical protein